MIKKFKEYLITNLKKWLGIKEISENSIKSIKEVDIAKYIQEGIKKFEEENKEEI